MKKILVSIALIAAAAFSANAQYRVEAGIRLACYEFNDTDLFGPVAPEVRAFANLVNFADGGIEIGLGFGQDAITNESLKSKMNISNLELPIHLFYGFDLGHCNLAIYAGLYGSYALAGKTVTAEKLINDPFDGPTGMKRANFGLDDELILTIRNQLTIGIGAQSGFLNVCKDKDISVNAAAFFATIGWRF